jgi:predicted RNA-binding Zn-ribbon protein involved in translation (DUF1610 family)
MILGLIGEKMGKIIKFVCPECGGTVLDECMKDVYQHSTISQIEEEDGEAIVDYAENSITTDEGEVYYYCCVKCGFALNGPYDNSINNNDELLEWILENCPQD